MKTRFFALATLVLALAACNKDNENLNGDPVAARFTADIAPATRASGTTWTGGDRIGITDIGNDSQYGNVPFILKNGKFEAEGKVIYIEDTKTHTFRAYYPYNAAGGTLAATTNATAQQNQSAIDFLFASGATGDKNSPVVSFTDKTGKGGEDNSFHHRMSRITLTFEAGDGVDFSVVKPERYTLDGLILTGTFNTADGLATADNGAQAGELAMDLADGNLTSSVILFPQTAASLPLVVNYKSQEFHATLTVPEGALQAGNRYTYTITVKANGIEVAEATSVEWTPGGEEEVESIVFKTDLSTAKVGDFYTSDGTLIELPEGMTLPNDLKQKVIGIVLKAGRDTEGSWADNCDYKLKGSTTSMSEVHGYVLALRDANGGNSCPWGSYGTKVGCDMNETTGFNGYSSTQTIVAFNNAQGGTLQDAFPAAYHATTGYEAQYPAPANTSGWFLPSGGQCWYWFNNRDVILRSVQNAGGDGWKNWYWSSSEYYDRDPAIYVCLLNMLSGVKSHSRKNLNYAVRACLAF